MANGVSDVAIAKRYGLARSSVQRHRTHVGGPAAELGSRAPSEPSTPSNAASLPGARLSPSADEVGAAYSSIGARIDAIAAKAEQEGSLAVALVGLQELRSTVTAQAQLAGHVGSGAAVQVNTQVNVDLGAAVQGAHRRPSAPPRRIDPSRACRPSRRRGLTARSPRQRLEAVIDGDK